jgi:hypothetical protein
MQRNNTKLDFQALDSMLMLNRKERILVKTLVEKALRSANLSSWLSSKLGDDYIQVAEELLMTMEVTLDEGTLGKFM